jgi:hypothetical protein
LEEDEGETDKGASSEGNGECANGAVSDMGEEMQDNVDNVTMIQNSPIGETICRLFLDTQRKQKLEALKSRRGVAEEDVLPVNNEKALINSTMVAAEAEAGRETPFLLTMQWM